MTTSLLIRCLLCDLYMFSVQHYIGTALGTVISIFVTGLLAGNLGWANMFYIEGALSLIWCFAWGFIVQDSPDQQKIFIHQEEKDYIAASLGQSHSKEENKRVILL